MKDTLEAIAENDGRYKPDGVRFVYEGLGYTVKNLAAEPGHVSGQLLCKGLKEMALQKWGRLAMLVLNSWNIKTTRDFGEIVYLMIKYKWMSAQPNDSIEDFDNVYDLGKVLKEDFKF